MCECGYGYAWKGKWCNRVENFKGESAELSCHRLLIAWKIRVGGCVREVSVAEKLLTINQL